jgi:hypothetical protein
VKLKQSEIKNLIKQALDKHTDLYEAMKEEHNSQVVLMAQYAKGVKDTLSDVLSAMNGNPSYLRILAEKR